MQGKAKSNSGPVNKRLQQRINHDILLKLWHKYNPKTHNLPVGVTDFAQLMAKHPQFYADKTMFVRQILDLNMEGLKMLLFTRPAGWGKSINISMVRYYFNCEVNFKGVPLAQKPHHSLFFGGTYKLVMDKKEKEVQLKPLTISDPKIYKNNYYTRNSMGEFITIFLKFTNISGSNYVQIKRGILETILRAYEDHIYLKNTDKADVYNTNKKQIERLLSLSYETFSKESIEPYLQKLQHILHDFYKDRECFILIDDIDHPVIQFLENSGSLNEARNVAHVIAQILAPILNSAKKLKIIAMAKINILETFVGSYKEFGIFDDKFFHYFGFAQEQITNNLITPLLSKVERNMKTTSEFMLRKIINSYGGYLCSYYSQRKIEPASAIKYLQACIASQDILSCQYKKQELNDSWFVEHLVSISGITKLFQYHSLYAQQSKPTTKQELFPLQAFLNKTNQFLLTPQINYISYLFGVMTGKFDAIGKWKLTEPSFPNKSATDAIGSAIIDKFGQNFGFSDFSPIDILSSSDCCQKFEEMLGSFFRKQVQINRVFVAGAFYYRYRYSSGKKFKTSHEYLHSDTADMIDNVYLPIEKSDQAVILHFHYEQEYQSPVEDVFAEMVYQIVQSDEFQRAFNAASLLGEQIEQFVLRFLLVMPDDKLEMLKVISQGEDVIFSSKEVENLSKNVKCIQIKQEWSRLRRLGLLKKGRQAINILHILASHIILDGTNLEDLIDIQASKRQRRFDLNAVRGPACRKFQPKHLRTPRPP